MEQTEGLGISLNRHGGHHELGRLFEDFDTHLLIQLAQLNLPYLCVHAVTYDDSIRVELTAKRITPRVTDGYGEVCWDAVLYNQEDEIVATYDILPLVEKVNTTYAYSISSAQRR